MSAPWPLKNQEISLALLLKCIRVNMSNTLRYLQNWDKRLGEHQINATPGCLLGLLLGQHHPKPLLPGHQGLVSSVSDLGPGISNLAPDMGDSVQPFPPSSSAPIGQCNLSELFVNDSITVTHP